MKTIKKILIITIPISLMIIFATACIKRKNCDCALEGKFVYFKEPIQVLLLGPHDRDVNAIFYPNGGGIIYIQDYIPIKFRTNDTINVSICVEVKINAIETHEGHICPCKIKCIEKIE